MIKTRIAGEALQRALEKHQRWLDRYAAEQAAAADRWAADPERARRADKLQMAKARLRSETR